MELVLKKIPKKVTIIEGFPGFGLVGTIATEFLINHLDTEEVGQIFMDKATPMVAVHNFELVKPITIHYNKKYNLLIIHSINPAIRSEVPIALAIKDLMKKSQATQLISIEGVMNQADTNNRVFYYTSMKGAATKLEKVGLEPLKEGIVAGVTAGLLARNISPMISLFAEVHSQFPDSRASAEVVKVLNSHLGLKLDTKPLIEQASKFEEKIKNLVSKSKQVSQAQEQNETNYFG